MFKGTAWYYARYRPSYPQEVFRILDSNFHLDGTGSPLDLGCGPGDLAVPLSPYFENVLALDADADMLAEGQRKARQAGVSNIRWVQGRAEELPADWGPFGLVTIGKAFHWMEQRLVLRSIRQKLKNGGGIAIIGEMGRLWSGREKWYSVVLAVMNKYLGTVRRSGKGMFKSPEFRWEDVLNEYFSRTVFDDSIIEKDQWDVDSLLGYIYSTSYCSREMLGANIDSFERDLRAALLEYNPQNRFEENIRISVLMGWKQ